MNRLALSVFIAALVCSATASLANEPNTRGLRKAEQNFIEFDYFDALDGFLAAYQTTPDNPYIVRRIADCYRLMSMPEEAIVWYRKLTDQGGYEHQDALFEAEVLKTLGHYELATQKMAAYNALEPTDSRGVRHVQQPNYHIELNHDNGQTNVEATEANIRRALLPPTRVNELLLIPIANDIDGPWFPHRRNLVTYNLYQTTVDDGYNLVSAELVPGEVHTRFSEGPSCYDSKRETLLVTRFLTRKGRPALDLTDQVYAMILCYQHIDGQWLETDVFPYNDDLYSTAYPTVSPDGNTLYFSSTREGSLGGMDLFSCRWDDAAEQWGAPQNLGSAINTEGNEIYPRFSPDGTFTFSSDGHPGLGGLDIFFADLNATPPLATNPGLPINTVHDDFGLMFIGEQYGYFCSDRSADLGGDDLFWWEAMREVIDASIVLMDDSGQPMYPEKVAIKNVRTDEEKRVSGLRGKVNVAFNGKDPYELTWTHNGVEMAMFCRPEQTAEGIRYVYSARGGGFMADAAINSYKESAFRKRKVALGRHQNKNLTDAEHYPAAPGGEPGYLMASWQRGIADTPAPAEGSKVMIKNLETGAVSSSVVVGGSAEFYTDTESMMAMTWVDASDRKVVRYLRPDRDSESKLAFTEGSPCTLYFNETPQFASNDEPNRLIAAALMASSEEGVLLESAADALLAYVEAGRTLTVEDGITRIHADEVYFGFDKFTITRDERHKLADLAVVLNEVSGARITVIAHTDTRGSRTYNDRLSRLRASATKKALRDLGVDDDRITILWHGEEMPLNDCLDGVPCDPKKHRMNRRAELIIELPTSPMAANH